MVLSVSCVQYWRVITLNFEILYKDCIFKKSENICKALKVKECSDHHCPFYKSGSAYQITDAGYVRKRGDCKNE